MHFSMHEARTPRFGRRFFQIQENFVRGNSKLQNPMFFVANTEERLAKNHPLRAVKRRADDVLKQMSRAFDAAYSEQGRPSIPPEQLLKALLLQALYSIPSERRLARKSSNTAALLCHSAQGLMENRHGLCLDIRVAAADGHAERDEAKRMLRRFRRRHGVKPKTVGGDAGYEAGAFLHEVEQELQITPHVPITSQRVTSASEGGEARRRMLRRMKTLGYQISQRARKKIEQMFGWLKQAGGLRKVRHVGRWKIQQVAYLWAAA